MNIKTTLSDNKLSIFFNASFANINLILVLLLSVLAISGNLLTQENIHLPTLVKFITVGYLFIIIVLWFIGSFDRSQKENKNDLKKSFVYILFLNLILMVVHHYHIKFNPPIPIEPKMIKVDKIKVVDLHKSKKDVYGFEYIDSKGKVLWRESYSKRETRDRIASGFFDQQKNQIVEAYYIKEKDGESYISIRYN